MKQRLAITGALAAALVLFAGSALAADGARDTGGTLASDQTAAQVDLTSSTVAIPTAMSPSGPVSSTSYSSETWSSDEASGDADLQVITSTAAGTFALTGVVLDPQGNSVQGATVSVQPSGSASPFVSTATDANGAFSFINVPVSGTSQDFDLRVSASGFGAYAVVNDEYDAGDTYVTSVELTSTSQTFDESYSISDATLTGASSNSGYDSYRRVPPTILVAGLKRVSGTCQAASPTTVLWTRRYPWKFYVLHTMAGEIAGNNWPGGYFHIVAAKGNAAAMQNYAWYFRRHAGTAANNADVDDTTNYQCFRPHRKVRTIWRTWVGDVLDERIATSSGEIQLTQYRAGTYHCTESLYPADGNKLSQLGSKARDEQCGVDNWRNIDQYYYTGTVSDGAAPPAPTTSFTRVSGGVKLTFPSLVGNSHVGWRYQIDKFPVLCPDRTPQCWGTIYKKGWSWKSRNVPTTYTYSTAGCYRYRVKATNPVGASAFASFNNGNQICPG